MTIISNLRLTFLKSYCFSGYMSIRSWLATLLHVITHTGSLVDRVTTMGNIGNVHGGSEEGHCGQAHTGSSCFCMDVAHIMPTQTSLVKLTIMATPEDVQCDQTSGEKKKSSTSHIPSDFQRDVSSLRLLKKEDMWKERKWGLYILQKIVER
jgi:hypothetical protein